MDLAPDDFRRNNPRFQEENFQRNLDLVAAVERIAADKGCKASQLALAWVLAQGDDIIPIPGTKRRSFLDENTDALDVHLTPEELGHINESVPRGVTAGTRYAPEVMHRVNV